MIAYHRAQHAFELVALLHRREHVVEAQEQLVDLFRGCLVEAAAEGWARGDVPPEELAAFCVRVLDAAADMPAVAAVHRLVSVALDGIRSRE
jgi:hypothetical protein